MRRALQVELASKSYPISIGERQREELSGLLGDFRREGRRAAVLTDETIAEVQKDFLSEACGGLPVLILPPGEKTKSVEHLETVYDFLTGQNLERNSVLVVVGGGVIGDLGGVAAATYLRGIEYIQVPTTLLAMVDSSVGGKTGINLKAGKNLAGAFHHPRAVFIELSLLRTLSDREFSAGRAEVIKYGMLSDAQLFRKLVNAGRLTAEDEGLSEIVRR